MSQYLSSRMQRPLHITKNSRTGSCRSIATILGNLYTNCHSGAKSLHSLQQLIYTSLRVSNSHHLILGALSHSDWGKTKKKSK